MFCPLGMTSLTGKVIRDDYHSLPLTYVWPMLDNCVNRALYKIFGLSDKDNLLQLRQFIIIIIIIFFYYYA